MLDPAESARHAATLTHQGKPGPMKPKKPWNLGTLHISSKNIIYITWGQHNKEPKIEVYPSSPLLTPSIV